MCVLFTRYLQASTTRSGLIMRVLSYSGEMQFWILVLVTVLFCPSSPWKAQCLSGFLSKTGIKVLSSVVFERKGALPR